jgi:DNA primase
LAALSDFISHIFGCGAKEQMIWVDAKLVIASMANKSFVRDRTVMHLPAKPMG